MSSPAGLLACWRRDLTGLYAPSMVAGERLRRPARLLSRNSHRLSPETPKGFCPRENTEVYTDEMGTPAGLVMVTPCAQGVQE